MMMKSMIFNPIHMLKGIASPHFFCAALLALSLSSASTAQKISDDLNPQQKEKIQALRIALFVESLELTAEESVQFWPVWNEVETNIRDLNEKIREKEKSIAECSTDEAAHKLTQEIHALQNEMLTLKFDGYEQFSEIIGQRRAALIPQIERKFRGQMMRRMGGDSGHQNKGQNRGFQGRPGPH
ncbi:MAG: hypothetical protein O2818_03170 [Bacteroidetes bacterium]|nr:hypothetical protein [Bacteroidota bacterium]MDA1335868.1 hypothetical protein [Bacteroidota bacterium]